MGSRDKIISFRKMADLFTACRKEGPITVYSHGVFDLLHVGHIKHLEAARREGRILAVTIVPDRFVQKGPHRPVFSEGLRAEAVAALSCVDFVAISDVGFSHEAIYLLRPDVYARGIDPGNSNASLESLRQDEEAARDVGARLFLTQERGVSTSSLANLHMNLFSPEARAFLDRFRQEYTPAGILQALRKVRSLKVLTVGETIIDEYHLCNVMAKASKEPILAARHLYTERYAGGILAIANHVASFCDQVGLLTMLGEIDSWEEFIRAKLQPNVAADFVVKPGTPTIVKTRFLEEYLGAKLFEVYTMSNETFATGDEEAFCEKLGRMLPECDLVVVADYGHGLLTRRVVDRLCSDAPFLAVNAQTNAGNRGFNLITKYPRADYISIDEAEARLEVRDERADIREVVRRIAQRIDCPRFMVTRGKYGSLGYDADAGFSEVPAFALKLVDRIGAGDAVLSVAAPCAASGLPMELIGFLGNVAGAEACATMGNKKALDFEGFWQHILSLLC